MGKLSIITQKSHGLQPVHTITRTGATGGLPASVLCGIMCKIALAGKPPMAPGAAHVNDVAVVPVVKGKTAVRKRRF